MAQPAAANGGGRALRDVEEPLLPPVQQASAAEDEDQTLRWALAAG